jgi:Cupin domain
MTSAKRYCKVVVTADGGSAFEDAEIPLSTQLVAQGTPPMRVGALAAESAVQLLQTEGFGSERHPAPAEQWVIVLRGAIEVEASDGQRRRFQPGDLLFVADTVGVGHATTAVGDPPLEGLFIRPGA